MGQIAEIEMLIRLATQQMTRQESAGIKIQTVIHTN